MLRHDGEEPFMKIAVIAMGKIGLPLAVQFASKGHEVIGIDRRPWPRAPA